MTVERFAITDALVERLIAAQFAEYAGLPITRVEPGGNDNRTFRVGDEFMARLPSGPGYVAGVDKEHRWLPMLAPQLPLPIPNPVGRGVPGEGYPSPWTLLRWMPGSDLTAASDLDRSRLAVDLGRFLVALQASDAEGGPPAGEHCFYRGASLRHYDAQTRDVLASLEGVLPDLDVALRIWEKALVTEWREPARWFHGDIAAPNLLADDGALSAVIDFGTCGVGDPACDLVIAWTFFDLDERRIFAEVVGLDEATWQRARGWALWKALITVAWDAERAVESTRVFGEILVDPVGAR